MKKIYLSLILFSISFIGFAQQNSQYTQYMYNTSIFNPAYVGSEDVLKVTGLYRSQWVGLEGAPETLTFAINDAVGKNVGLGLSFIQDKIGPGTETNVNADFSYTLRFNNSNLAFGIKAGANWLNVDFNKLSGSENDPLFTRNIDNRFTPNVGVGTYYYSDKYYIGLSVPQLLKTEHFKSNENAETYLAKEELHAYLMGGYVFDINRDLRFKPAFLMKAVNGAPLQVDISANFLIYDKLTLGGAYRYSAALSGLIGFQVSQNLFLGYAYDAETSELRNYNSGSHEFFLRFDIFNTTGYSRSPRFF
ncbi:PorP/SprF family type IX secretion system membrane protein [Christiangramia salexigens]|uniref:Type IX secretion system membrane protein PorP/SprF n=1 Tax=Christiangramia salexigens TaxID=1913577 RepID=A0A1L3J694_9FLAO|nr:type IX secretion system membrane protein PorP/SprF [Christiangramia salexigens]APG60647.1 hypothetical protein LPB144_09635 [Christiangramia salexigens]